jgi:hypothetical protein
MTGAAERTTVGGVRFWREVAKASPGPASLPHGKSPTGWVTDPVNVASGFSCNVTAHFVTLSAVMTTVHHILDQKGHQVWSVHPGDTVYDAIKMMADKISLTSVCGDPRPFRPAAVIPRPVWRASWH